MHFFYIYSFLYNSLNIFTSHIVIVHIIIKCESHCCRYVWLRTTPAGQRSRSLSPNEHKRSLGGTWRGPFNIKISPFKNLYFNWSIKSLSYKSYAKGPLLNMKCNQHNNIWQHMSCRNLNATAGYYISSIYLYVQS